MTNNIKLSARKTSFILAVSCILFSVIATYLYINHQIDLTRYTTPIILGTVVIIITCGGLQRVFYIFLTDECPQIFSDNQRNSIPDKVIPKPDMIIEECSEPTVEVSDIEMIEVSNATEVISMIELPKKTKNTDTTENKAVSSEIITSITISEQHDDSKEIKVLEQQPTSEVKPEAFSYLQGFESRMKEIQKELNLTYLFIAHDLSVVQYMSDRIMVMYLGKIVEVADSKALYDEPLHPYTKALLSAIPVADIHHKKKRQVLEGEVPSPIHKPSGCAFHNRCPYCMDICKKEDPVLRYHGADGHMTACHLYDGSEVKA